MFARRAAAAPHGWPQRGWRDRLGVVLTGPLLLRPIFSVLRRCAPVLRVGRRVIVSKHADVVEVLRRDTDFTIAEVNGSRMARWSGAFLLGTDRGEVYERESRVLLQAASVDDLAQVRAIVVGAAGPLLEAARPTGRLDVVNGLARVVATRVVGDYFGTPGPDDASTMRWMRALFDGVFLDDGPRARRAASLAVAEQRPYMEHLIATTRASLTAGEPVPDTVLSRLVALGDAEPWLDDDAVRRCVNGLIVGALETTSKAVTHVVDELLRRPEALAAARRAALDGDLDTVRGYAWEALRFRPHGILLVRSCARDTTLGRTRVPAGSQVMVATISAMLDEAAFPQADRLLPDRPDDRYLHFGHGLHACLGRHINAVQVSELVAAVVRLPGLRRAEGADGRVSYDGPFPDRLVVAFDPHEPAMPGPPEAGASR